MNLTTTTPHNTAERIATATTPNQTSSAWTTHITYQAVMSWREETSAFSPGHTRRMTPGRGWRWLSRSIRTSAAAQTAAHPRLPSWRGRSWSQSHTRECPWWVYVPARCPADWERNSGRDRMNEWKSACIEDNYDQKKPYKINIILQILCSSYFRFHTIFSHNQWKELIKEKHMQTHVHFQTQVQTQVPKGLNRVITTGWTLYLQFKSASMCFSVTMHFTYF